MKKETRKDAAGEKEQVSWLRRALAQLRIKLTLPYIFLALAVAIAAAILVTWLLASLLDDRFQTALTDAGKTAADTVVYVEREQLDALRLVAYTKGLAEAVAEGDEDTVALLAAPLAINGHLDCLEVLDADGDALLAMHRRPGGGVLDYDFDHAGTDYGEWEMVRKVLAGEADEIDGELHDKYAGLVETEWGWVFYTVGPIKKEGELVGAALVGTYHDHLAERLDRAALAHVSIYVGDGQPLVSTLAQVDEERAALALDAELYQTVLADQDKWVHRRDVEVAERGYAEVFGPFEARYGRDIGVLSVAMPLSFVTDARHPVRNYLVGLFGVAIVVVLAVGALVASRVVRRLQQLTAATKQVATGDLDTQVEMQGYDEVASLAGDFNYMVAELREGRTYRDLLGLTASPEVAQQLRRALEGGRVQLDPQLAIATVLFCDIRGFTRLSESQPPRNVINFLNEYMQGIVRIIREHNGVINKFVGDAALAFYGLLPEARPPAEGAHEAVETAMAMLNYLDELNRQRVEREEEPLRIGIGINTGSVVAGMVGSDVRLEYTVIGDAVNIAQRLSDLNKEYPQYDVFFSTGTYDGLDDELRGRSVHVGEVQVKGRAAPIDVYSFVKE